MSQKLVHVVPKTMHVVTDKDVYTVIAIALQIAASVAEHENDPIEAMSLNAENPQKVIWLTLVSNFHGVLASDPYRWASREMRFLSVEERRTLFKTHVFAREKFEDLKVESKYRYPQIEVAADDILTRSKMEEWVGPERFIDCDTTPEEPVNV